MKAIMVTIAAAFFSLSVAAHNPGVDPANYCVKTINGKTVVQYNGTVITKEIKFKDGSCVKPNGTVLLASGKTIKLKEGECVSEDSVKELSERRTDKMGDQKDWETEKIPMDKPMEEFPDRSDSSKTDKTLDPDRFKNDQTNPGHKGEDQGKGSDELPPPKK